MSDRSQISPHQGEIRPNGRRVAAYKKWGSWTAKVGDRHYTASSLGSLEKQIERATAPSKAPEAKRKWWM